MKRISALIVKHKVIISIIIAILTLISGVVIFFVRLNSDMISYLPKSMPTSEGLAYMKEHFGMEGDATVGINGASEKQVEEIVAKIQAVKGLKKDGVMWYGSIDSLAGSGGVLADGITPALKENKTLRNLLHPKIDSKDQCYILMLFLDVPSSSNEASAALDEISAIIQPHEHVFGGGAQLTRAIFKSVYGDIAKFLIAGFLIILFILLITTTSILEPAILLLTLGSSIIINLGTNIIFGSISTVTFAISSLLQIGLSMDYAIFLMHAFYDEREYAVTDNEAMRKAIPKTFSTVFSSALTTVFGFISLFFMRFTMGADIGRVLAKGVLISMLIVIVLQPCLILIFRKALTRTSHKILVPRFNKFTSFSIKHSIPIVVVCLALFIVAITLQSKMEYSYMKMGIESKNPTKLEQRVNVVGNSIVLIVPVKNGMDDLEKQRKFNDDLIKINGVSDVMGIYNIMPRNDLVIDSFISRNLTTSNMFESFIKNKHTIYTVMIEADPESKEATRIMKDINHLVNRDENFKGQETYITGTAQSIQDLAAITPQDFIIVSALSILAIFIILLFTLKSIKLSAILVFIIQIAIFINLAISYFAKLNLNFMAYIVISAVQLGATVDYAILFAVKFQRYKKQMSIIKAVYKAMNESAVSIITSASIIAGATLTVSLLSSNLIVKQLTLLIGRGAIISCILILFVLPAATSLFMGQKKFDFYKMKKMDHKNRWKKIFKKND